MTSTTRRWLASVLVLLMPAAVSGQEVDDRWRGLARSELSTVHVLDDAGAETTGRLLQLTPDALVLLVDGTERRFDAARVRRIERRGDSLKNGALIGLGIGTGMGLLAAGISDCPENPSGSCPGFRVAGALT